MYVLLLLAVLLGTSKNIFTKIVKNNTTNFCDTMKINVITFSCAFIVVFLMGLSSLNTMFQVPWILVICYAVCTLGSQISLMKAVELGSVSISSLFYSCGFILPTLFGSIYYQEPLHTLHIIGIILIVCSFVCSAKREKDKPFKFSWLIAALGGMFFSGMVGIMQKLFTNDYTQYQLNNFLCVAFLLIILMSVLAVFISRLSNKQNQKQQSTASQTKGKKENVLLIKQRIFTIALGCVMGLVNKANIYLSGILPSVIVFPVINGGGILATTICSRFIFKEKLSWAQKIGLLLGILGIISITIGKLVIDYMR